MGSLSERDLRALVGVIDDGLRDEPGPGMPWAVLEGLRGLIPCEEVGFVEQHLPRHWRLIQQGAIEGGERCLDPEGDSDSSAEDHLFWKYYRDFLGSSEPERTDELRRVVHWGELYTPTELRNQPLYAEYFYPEGIKHGMFIGLPTLPGRTRRVLFRRYSGRDFSDRDKLILQLLRPHLHAVFQDAQRRRQALPRLTRREWQVLQLAAQGNSYADIAAQLFVAISTVRKHMEHILDRTGTHNRSAAVARMMPGLTGPTPGRVPGHGPQPPHSDLS